MRSKPDVLQLVKDGNIDDDVYPLSIRLLKEFRNSAVFKELVLSKMSLGSESMKDIGNVYCAALPAWIAAGLEEAAETGKDLTNRNILAVGYGSGDAAEAIPACLVKGWENAALKIGFKEALESSQTLTKLQYESLHDTGLAQDLMEPENGFVIESVGQSSNPNFSDEGIEYYRFIE